MKAILLAATALTAMTVACEGQSAAARAEKFAKDKAEASIRLQAKANKEAAEAKKLFETGNNLFGVDKQWNDNDYAGTIGNKQLSGFKVGDWGRTTVQFRVLDKINTNEFLAITRYGEEIVVLIRGLDTAKVTDDAEFILPYVIVIPGTYEYRAGNGSRKSVLVLERDQGRADEFVATERARRAAEEPTNQIENAKRRLWLEQPAELKIVAGACPSINGTWWNGVVGEGRQFITILQGNKSAGFMAHSSYKIPKGDWVRWQFNGSISETGQITGKLKHTKAPKGFANQTHIAVVSPDGKTITGTAVFDTQGGHDYVWTRVGKSERTVVTELLSEMPEIGAEGNEGSRVVKNDQISDKPVKNDVDVRSRFIGKWRVLNAKGGTIFVITLDEAGNSQTTNVAGLTGKWDIVGNDVRITWDGDWRDIIRNEKDGFHKFAFKPGITWTDKPHENLKIVHDSTVK